ncbi:MAG TPA: aspartate/glutamate racemase family protein [Thermoanaerobaculia bacterium]|jgi:aspartate racemase|nr:aspartate/glutamate racemase family protein [Thermoanaerobaculia bacterium]HPA50981.1 aspartate/glutamate racemase family protein [Thermoanaerobaculia bacterium]HQN06295.1 aspartate/glutamate racemase family protein [Thermoanaerobaculia bacterium]HQP86611.1 aspartate/glutamate racemase family protein [Thermoanaerobaculia bacterium]
MKTIGLLGGMSWESTVPYYVTLNRVVAERLGGLHSARVLLSSVDFAPLEALMRARDWDEIGKTLAREAVRLEEAGARVLVLCTNTMHKVAETLEAAVGIPLVHITDVTGTAVRAAGLRRVGLLGTRFTMEEDFYAARLARLGIEVLTPPADARAFVDRVIFEELCRGQFLASSRSGYAEVMQDLVSRGAEGIVLACTEIGLLLGDAPFPVPLFDTAEIHARAAADAALA